MSEPHPPAGETPKTPARKAEFSDWEIFLMQFGFFKNYNFMPPVATLKKAYKAGEAPEHAARRLQRGP